MKWVSKADDKAKEAERKRDEMYSRLTEMVFQTLEKNKEIEKNDHTEAVKHRKELIRKCNEYAQEMMTKTQADKVVIFEYCNGTQNLTGIPFLHFKTLAEKLRVLKVSKFQDFKKYDIGSLGSFTMDLEHEGTITFKNINKYKSKYPDLLSYMMQDKQYKGVYCNIAGNEFSLGFIQVTFRHNDNVDYALVEKTITQYAQKISSLLDYQNINS